MALVSLVGARGDDFAVVLTADDGAVVHAADGVVAVSASSSVAAGEAATFAAGATAVVAGIDDSVGDVTVLELVLADGAVDGDGDVGAGEGLAGDLAGGRGDDDGFDPFDIHAWSADGFDIDAVAEGALEAGVDDDDVLAGEIGDAGGLFGADALDASHAGIELGPFGLVGDNALFGLGDAGVLALGDGGPSDGGANLAGTAKASAELGESGLGDGDDGDGGQESGGETFHGRILWLF